MKKKEKYIIKGCLDLRDKNQVRGENKKFMLSALICVLLFFAVFVSIGSIGYSLHKFIFNEKYDSAKHDCDEWMCEYNDRTAIVTTKNDVCPEFFPPILENRMCYKFHDKPFCTKCLNSWTVKCDDRCECTERETKTSCYKNETLRDLSEIWRYKYILANRCIQELKYQNPCWDCSVERLIEECGNWSYYREQAVLYDSEYEASNYCVNEISNKCISAREKDECEKGDTKWVWDCPDSQDYSKPSGCGATVCRPKTQSEKLKEKLTKYDCEKLAWDLIMTNMFNDNYGDLSRDNVRDIYMLKGCKLE